MLCYLDFSHRRLFVAALVLVALNACSSSDSSPQPQPTLPADAWGFDSDPLPEGATLVDASEFDALATAGQLRRITPQILDQDRLADDAQAAQDEQDIVDYVAEVKAGRTAPPPNFEEKMLGTVTEIPGVVEQGGDGNFIVFNPNAVDPDLSTRTLLGRRARSRILAEGIRKYKTRENHIGVFRQLYQAIPADVRTRVLNEVGLPLSDDLDAMSLDELIAVYPLIASAEPTLKPFFVLPPTIPPTGYPASCQDEVGFASNVPHSAETYVSELNNGKCDSHAPGGIYSLHIWPLKFFNTCVKDQGARGSCSAFATVGAAESLIAKNSNKWVNLSEQDLYYRVKAEWFPANYGDGAYVLDMWKQMVATSYKIPYESTWPYNTSPGRFDLKFSTKYSGSCLYNNQKVFSYAQDFASLESQPYCSETTHQGRIVCSAQIGYTYCGYADPVKLKLGQYDGYQFKQIWEIWNEASTTNSLNFARTILAAGYPIVLSFDVPAYFKDAKPYLFSNNTNTGVFNSTGGGNSAIEGSHAILVTGFISNEELAGINPDMVPGLDGGYFIVKNSWSSCWGDAGYGFLSQRWVGVYGIAMYVLETLQ